MFTEEELHRIINSKEFLADYSVIQQSLVNSQALQNVLFAGEIVNRLGYLTEAILSSSELLRDSGTELFRIGAETAEVLAQSTFFEPVVRKRLRFRAVLLYELAN